MYNMWIQLTCSYGTLYCMLFCNYTLCTIHNLYASEFFLMTTGGPQLFFKHPQNHFIYYNGSATFQCFANSSNTTITITWEKDKRSYSSGVAQRHSNGVSSSLTLNRATVTDSGKYRCRATNVDGNSSTSNEAELLS